MFEKSVFKFNLIIINSINTELIVQHDSWLYLVLYVFEKPVFDSNLHNNLLY